METKRCSKCGETKPLSEFYEYRKSKDGKTHHCKCCYIDYRQSKREHYRQYMEDRRKNDNDSLRETKRKSYRNLDPRKKMLQGAHNRSKMYGYEFNIELEDIVIPDKCPLLNVPFILGTKDDYEYTHSLDRINETRGYIKGNVWVITKKANSMKNSATKEELITFANNILKYFKDSDIVQTNGKPLELTDKELLS